MSIIVRSVISVFLRLWLQVLCPLGQFRV
jgi:hypothetical protein